MSEKQFPAFCPIRRESRSEGKLSKEFVDWIEMVVGASVVALVVSWAPTEREAIIMAAFLIVFEIIRESKSIKRAIEKSKLGGGSDE